MRRSGAAGALLLIVLLAGCTPGGSEPTREVAGSEQSRVATPDAGAERGRAGGRTGAAVVGQTVYVPVYSHIYFRDEEREVDLAATVSVRNTDPEYSITVTTVQYYDSGGHLVRQYGEETVVLPPLSSQAYVVEEEDRTGGVGANFIIEWEASAQVSPPITEAVMISTASTQGISFVSRGEVVRSFGEVGGERTHTE
ncbi:MAG: DUF3124 domain-containing protein [Rhodothermaceae bacterium]|nr:DUF3124 domain-containing protein [Rhodothermaceae bacterium]